jgi:hypothetical protein
MVRKFFPFIVAVVIQQFNPTFAETTDIKTAPQGKKPSMAQDLFKILNFDKQAVGETPAGFSSYSSDTGLAGLWKIQPDAGAPTAPNILMQAAPCPAQDCFHVLLVDELVYEYPDVAIRLRLTEGAIGTSNGWAGLAFGARDGQNFYATVVDLGMNAEGASPCRTETCG